MNEKAALILGIDANAHSRVWGIKDDNVRGECLLSFIISNMISICNKGNTPIFKNNVSKAFIDIY